MKEILSGIENKFMLKCCSNNMGHKLLNTTNVSLYHQSDQYTDTGDTNFTRQPTVA
ncbi:hypothetical protein [Mucilaginibacter flavidus]|uniref:hypothetical protein n=1 Tax=Mucilaginibacter flavidus TaxID=2949309 RepID=UPI002092CE12|nr:hypothetical protein [Mucilaginibacter flavidus]MCO5947291.1 hypothetical protein [Mucilaginibacter flavidus]